MKRAQFGHFGAPHDDTTQQAHRVTWGIDAYTATGQKQAITQTAERGVHTGTATTTATQTG